MNKTKIEWCDMTWNPITGCKHNCEFCYARKIAERFRGSRAFPQGFDPSIHTERLPQPYRMKDPQTIFVVSMGDLFGNWIPDYWIDRVVDAAIEAPRHTYIFLTKNPDHMRRYFTDKMPRKNFWLGTSVGESKPSWTRMPPIQHLGDAGWNTFLSVEPLKEFPFIAPIWMRGIGWVIIGMQTNPLEPCEPDVLEAVVKSAESNHIPVFLKDSTLDCFGRVIVPRYREFPQGIKLNKDVSRE